MKLRAPWALAVTLVLMAGCGPKPAEVTIQGSDGTTVTSKSDNSGNVTMQSNGPQGQTNVSSSNGNVTATTTDAKGNTTTAAVGNQVDLSQLGVKLYPGSTPKQGTSVKADSPDGSSMAVVLDSTDDPTKVTDFYKSDLKPENTLTTPTGAVLSGKLDAGRQFVITVTKEDKGCSIGISVIKKNK